MIELGVVLCLVAVGYFTGRHFESKHYKSIIEREKALAHIPVISGKWKELVEEGEEASYFGGSVVVASDYFKSFVAGLRSLVGGRLNTYESLLDRGRREAQLRMKEQAVLWGATKIINFRIETSIVSDNAKQNLPNVELFAYGTALRPKK